MGKIKFKKAIIIFAALAIFASGFFISRGEYVSRHLKEIILPELSSAIGRQVTAGDMYINLFPLFIGINDLKIKENGIEIFHAPAVKGYMGVLGFLRKEIILKRLLLKKPDVRSSFSQLKDIINKVEEYQKTETRPALKVTLKAVVMDDGKFAFGYNENSFRGSGVNGEAILSTYIVPEINFTVKDISCSVKGLPELKAELKGAIAFKKDFVDVKKLRLGFYGSAIDAGGSYTSKNRPPLNLDIRSGILMNSLKKLFNLKQSGEGELSAQGTLTVGGGSPDDWLRPVIDMKLKGDFYIQTLMELLKVDEKIEGLVNLNGELKGPVNNLAGNANVRLKNGNLFKVDFDELNCRVVYRDGILKFEEGKGLLYNGHADLEASFAVPWTNYYSLAVKFSGIDSPAVLNLINWRPEIPMGKVQGELSTSGSRFNPSGWFDYRSTAAGKDVLGRIREIKGSFSLNDDILTLADTDAATGKSGLTVNGDIDINASTLSLGVRARSEDLADLTVPFLHELTGSGNFSGTITGKFDNPVISGISRLNAVSFEGYGIGNVSWNLEYRKDLLEVRELSTAADAPAEKAATAVVKGNIRFNNAAGLFDLNNPVYDLSLAVRDADFGRFIKLIYKKPFSSHLEGSLNTDSMITGPGPMPSVNGFVQINNAKADKLEIGSVTGSFSYENRNFLFKNATLTKFDSTVRAEGKITNDGHFNFKAIGSKVFLRDVVQVVPADFRLFGSPVRELSLDGLLNIRAEGSGTMDAPDLELEGSIRGGKFRGMETGDGRLRASLKSKKLFLDAHLFNEKTILTGKASMEGNMPWTARLEVNPGRYDFVIGTLLKDVPDDLLLNVKGIADMSGDKDHFQLNAALNHLNITLYGYSFANDAAIRFNVRDRSLTFSPFTLRSGNTSFKVSGGMELAKEYDLAIEGGIALAPLKGLFKKIDTIRGDASFVFTVTGRWETPKVSGGVEIADGVFAVKDIPHRVSSINSYFYIDENRIVIEKFSGKVGGGDIDISGIAYLQKFKMKRFYINTAFNDLSVNISKDFSANFNGKILYQGTLESQTLSGEVNINRSRYRERVEWKTWLLKAKGREKPRGEVMAIEKAALNIRIYGLDNIAVDNNIARAALKVDLLLRGTVSHPVILGHVESKAGYVYFRNNEFRILNASADFSDTKRTNPVMEILAETSVKGYKIRMNLEGQLNRFNLSLVSDPPLEEMDIFSLLTVGKLGKELKGIESGISAGEATSFLTGKVQDVFEERVSSLIGFDRVEVDPYVSKTTGTVNPRVTLSKRLLGDNFYVTYSSVVGSTENNVLKVEYLIGRNISLIGIRDEKGSLGGDIKFRVEFK